MYYIYYKGSILLLRFLNPPSHQSIKSLIRKELFTCKEKNNKNRIPLSTTYNRTLPNISKIVRRNWNILQINTEFHGAKTSK